MLIRDAAAGDLGALQAIMDYYRQNTNHIWDRTLLTDTDMQAWLFTHSTPPYAALIAEEDGIVAGYASLSGFRPYSGYKDTAENSIYVAPGHACKGYGGTLMRALLVRAHQNGLRVVTAWIDDENKNSVRFHEKYGFYYAGILKNVGTLDNRPRSVVIMQYDVH